MSEEIGSYSFLPWLRHGLANQVVAPSDPTAKRGQITVNLEITGTGLVNPAPHAINKMVDLYGPGDIVGIERKAVIKTEPRHWNANFETNYLAYIDFYSEVLPWLYTPNAASGERLTPWISLVVLAETEFKNGTNRIDRPAPYFVLNNDVDAAAVFPKPDELWAWAHVHINRDIVGSGDNPISTNESAFVGRFKSVLDANPDLAYSRMLCPRKLGENVGYHAFLIPSFESGRLAGLGVDPTDLTGFGANTIAWEEYAERGTREPKSFPYYYRWEFHTSTVGDFEYLVRLLQPRVADSRVGRRDIDVLKPGSNIDGITDERLKGILRLGGALQVPLACLNTDERAEYNTYDNWYDPYPHLFQRQLAAFINLAEEYTKDTTEEVHEASLLELETDGDPDPLITPPLYGRWHSLTSRLLTNTDGTHDANWVHELNLDPRWRTTANFGTRIVQEHQEVYMDAAWDQIGDVVDANRRLGWSLLARFTTKIWYWNNIVPQAGVAKEKYLSLTTPIQKRILSQGKTVYHQVKTSRVPPALVSTPMRRMVRPRGRFARQLRLDGRAQPNNLIARVNRGEITPVRPRPVPNELLTHDDIVEVVKPPSKMPSFLEDFLSKNRWLAYMPLLLVLLLMVLLFPLGLVFVVLLPFAYRAYQWLRNRLRDIDNPASILPENQTPDAVQTFPRTPDFRITEPGDPFVPSTNGRDSAEAVRFKTALRDNFDFIERSAAAGKAPTYTELNIAAMVDDIAAKLDPAVTIPRYVLGHIRIPERIGAALTGEPVDKIMAYPDIDVPMYKPLVDLSTDYFVPNLNLIEQNSITLLETNQRFIEAYMVGLNHEFARELLWREYPTDQRGTYFRQFWDVSSVLNRDGLSDDALREKLRDIPPIHGWKRDSVLSDHDHREQGGDKEEEVVLVIRGELLKKYPTAEVYAHRAKWITDDDGNRLLDQPRDFDDSEPEDVVIKTPLYEAKVDPDIYFFGFDLDIIEAKGGSGEDPSDKAGWFFVIKERSGEPRFGLDIPSQNGGAAVTHVKTWNELSWSDVMDDGLCLTLDGTPTITVSAPSSVNDDEDQQKLEDSHLRWRESMNAAELAYILYQVPVLVGVHASEMLPDKCEGES